MGWIISAISGIWGYVGAAAIAAALAVAGTHYADSQVYGLQIAKLQLAQANTNVAHITASLNKLQGWITQADLAGTNYQATQTTLFAKLDNLNRTFRDAIKASPLPADCRPDAVRVRNLETAIDSANAAATGSESGFGETVRTTH